MQIKITQEGFEGFSGFVGNVEFHDGVSVGDVSKLEAETLAALYTVEEFVPAKVEEKQEDKQEPVLPTAEKSEAKADAEEAAEQPGDEEQPTDAAQ